jgi:hypothetical protein
MSRHVVLICQYADFEMTIEGSTFDRCCSKCGVRLMIAPSGQAALAREPSIVLLCLGCGVVEMMADGEPVELARLPIDAVMRDARAIRPNLRRYRN